MTNSKQGTVPSTDGAPALPAAGRVFGESPVSGRLTDRHPSPARADATEEQNLKNESAPTARIR